MMNYKQNTKCYLTCINKQQTYTGRRQRDVRSSKVIQTHGSKVAWNSFSSDVSTSLAAHILTTCHSSLQRSRSCEIHSTMKNALWSKQECTPWRCIPDFKNVYTFFTFHSPLTKSNALRILLCGMWVLPTPPGLQDRLPLKEEECREFTIYFLLTRKILERSQNHVSQWDLK